MQPDSGYIALIVSGSLLSVSVVLGAVSLQLKNIYNIRLTEIDIVLQILYLGYRHYRRRSVNSMNFENPAYRKTTEDHFSVEKNLPIYPSTVDEEVSNHFIH